MSFFEDWGPLNIAMVYRACIYIHELLEVRIPTRPVSVARFEIWADFLGEKDTALKQHRLVLYASEDPRRKANAALIMALYVVGRAPWSSANCI